MIRSRSLIGVVAVAGLLASGVAFAQGPRGGGIGGAGRGAVGGRGMVSGLPLASLNLTQAQQDLVRDIRERSREQLRQYDSRLREAQQAQRQAVNAIPVSESLIRMTTLALAEVQAEVAIQQARVQNEIFAALTPDQQEQVKRSIAAREQQTPEPQGQRKQRRQ